MDKVLLDTDVFSEIFKGRNARVARQAAAYRAEFPQYTISVLTVTEVLKGLHKMQREERIRQFLESLNRVELLLFDRPSAEIAGRIYGDLERTGQSIGRMDPMIAALAIHNGLKLATGNTEHYRRIQALGYPLELENWRE